MKNFYIFATIVNFLLIFGCTNDIFNKDQRVKSAYLGQSPPGLIPQAFAPGLVTSNGYEYGGVFTPDLNEFYFIKRNDDKNQQEVIVFRNQHGQWEQQVFSPRLGQHLFAPDGRTMHIGRRFMERTDAGDWSEVKELLIRSISKPVNTV